MASMATTTAAPAGEDVLNAFLNAYLNVTGTPRECVERNTLEQDGIGLFVIWTLSVAITIVLIAAQRRVFIHPDRCYGRPGLPIPIDFLVSPRNRFIYAILFGVMGTAVINGYGNFGSILSLETSNLFSQLINKILISPFFTVFSLVLEYFPLFATVEFSIPWFGYIIGFFYSIAWFLTIWVPRFQDYRFFAETCSLTDHTARAMVAVTILKDSPLILMGFFIVLWFCYKMALTCVWEPFIKKKKTTYRGELHGEVDWLMDHGIRLYHLDRVRSLLKKPIPPPVDTANKVWKLINRILGYLFPFQRNFKLPLAFLGGIIAMVMIVYQISLSLVGQTFILLSILEPLYNDGLSPLLDELNNVLPGNVSLTPLKDTLSALLIGVPAIIATAPFASVTLCIFLLIHLVSSIRKNIKSISSGGFKGQLPDRIRRVSGFWAYIGLQIGLFVTAWTVYTVIFILIGVVIMVLVFILKYTDTRAWFFTLVLGALIPAAWAKLLFTGQRLLCKYFFVADRGEDSKFIPIRHRRIYNWFAFVLFFYNGFAGLVGGVVRIITSAMFGVLLLFRLDLISLPNQLAWWDFGHKSFLSFIYLDYCYNNPVVHVFSHLLKRCAERNGDVDVGNVELVGADELAKKNSRGRLIRNRWLVAYTMVRNPSVQKYSAKNLKFLDEESKKDRVFALEHIIRGREEEEKEKKLVESISFGDSYKKSEDKESKVLPTTPTSVTSGEFDKFAYVRSGGEDETQGSGVDYVLYGKDHES